MVVGVNGVGKTTTIGKLAHQFKSAGKKVVLGAADTFRAAAVDQLIIWSERVGVPIVQQGMGADPASVAFDTLQSAKYQNADVVIRLPTGAGVGGGPFHSQSNESWFFHTPGLKIVYPSNPKDAKGLLNAAIADPNPILFFEHKAMYRSISDSVPSDYYTTDIGKASLAKEGTDISIITYGMGVHWAFDLLEKRKDISADVLDLRTLLPWDQVAVERTVKKTNRVLILHEDNLNGGIGAEIAAWISEKCFKYLDAPVMREGSLDTPVTFSKELEENYLPKKRMEEKVDALIRF